MVPQLNSHEKRLTRERIQELMQLDQTVGLLSLSLCEKAKLDKSIELSRGFRRTTSLN